VSIGRSRLKDVTATTKAQLGLSDEDSPSTTVVLRR